MSSQVIKFQDIFINGLFYNYLPPKNMYPQYQIIVSNLQFLTLDFSTISS